jgi:hypothetical protein
VLHAALVAGVAVIGLTFALLERLNGPFLPTASAIGTAFAAAGGVLVVAAFLLLRPRIPECRPDQSPDAYWSDVQTRTAALLTWVGLEGAGVVAAVGYLLTGRTAPAAVAVLALATLVWLRPSQIEGA